ncbi:MAG: hypothetical protein OEX10_04820 [Candidatus Bathyarchaeota archaeon]|nr:hypothetical protein [Candidatus Bathyarchaeota archaeon]
MSEENMTSWKEWKSARDIIFGIVVPTVVALVIIGFPTVVAPALENIDPSYTLNAMLVDGLGEAILIVAVPMFLGLLWNQWAGGASGFLLGSIYALYWSIQYSALGYSPTDIGLLGYVVSAMLIGYMAGALNKGSYSFRRMLIAGIVSGVIGGLILLWTSIMSEVGMVTAIPHNLFIMLPRMIYGVVLPIFATVFNWFGISPRQMG